MLPERLASLKAAHPHKRLLIYYQDEARFGQHGTITRVWARVGTRPRAIKQTQYDYLYVFSAVGHVAGALRVPDNVTLVHLPPKSPELNPAENLWHYLRSHFWSNRLYKTWKDLKHTATDAWRRVCLVPEWSNPCVPTPPCARIRYDPYQS